MFSSLSAPRGPHLGVVMAPLRQDRTGALGLAWCGGARSDVAWPRGGLWASTPGCLSRNHLLPAGWSQAPSTPMGRGCGQLGGFGVDRGRQDSHGRSVQGALPAGASPAASQRGQGQDTAGQPGPRVRWPRSAARRGLGVTGPQGQHGQGPSCPRLVLPGRQRWGQLHGGGGQQSEWLQMARLYPKQLEVETPALAGWAD